MVEKVRLRLASWKTNFLSRAGRLGLIKSTLNVIRSYYTQTTFFSISTLNELDRICNNFLWGENERKNRMHLVSKDSTFLPKKLGALELKVIVFLTKSSWQSLGGLFATGPKA